MEIEKAIRLSKGERPSIEITVKSGCGRMCTYCPQNEYIRSYKSNKIKELKLELLKIYAKNIPNNCLIWWTGFTEPLECSEFGEMVLYLDEKGCEQKISTTLTGKEHCKDFFENHTYLFTDITLHLPDSEGMMKGRFDQNYAEYLQKILEQCKSNNLNYNMFLIGKDWHPSVKNIVINYPSENVIEAKYLNTRAGSINPQEFGLKQTQKQTNDKTTYHCSYKRLNQGVLLPNGDISICCQDYSLKSILGNLAENSLDQIYLEIESNEAKRNLFVTGKMEPCVSCEHYRDVNAGSSSGRIE